jgi:uncharacterized protein YndB with AHSA1/START domain
MRSIGRGQYPKNPRLCERCFDGAMSAPGGCELEMAALFVDGLRLGAGECLISETAYRQAQLDWAKLEVRTLTVAGKAEPLAARVMRGRRRATEGGNTMTEGTTPIRLVAETRVDCAPEEAFAYVADLRTHPEWSPDDIRVFDADDAPVGTGWRCRTMGHSLVRGGEQDALIEVTEYDPPRRFAFRATSGTHEFENIFKFRSDGTRTVIERVLEHDAPAATIAKLKEVGPEVGRRRSEMFEMLKARLEA